MLTCAFAGHAEVYAADIDEKLNNIRRISGLVS